jgi:bacterioferritin-associated ferredoxin
MTDLTVEQSALKAKVTQGAIVGGALIGLVVGVITFFVAGAVGPVLAFPIALIVGGGIGYGAYSAFFRSGSRQAQCPKCATPFTFRETGRTDRLLSSDPRRETKTEPDPNNPQGMITRTSTWIEDKVEVTATSQCAHCQHSAANVFTETRERGRDTREVRTQAKGAPFNAANMQGVKRQLPPEEGGPSRDGNSGHPPSSGSF